MDRRTTKTTHYSLVALICVLIVTFALGMGGVATAGQDVAKTDAVSGFSKVGNFDMETLRQQYFSQTAVQETTASYSGKRWVIVELEGDSLFTSYENRGYWYGDFTTYCNSEEGKLLKADIEASHKDFLAVLDNNRIDYKYKYSYSTLNNGVALKVDADTFNEIKKLDGVKSVYYSESYAIPTVAVSNNANVYTTGIYDSSNLSYKGEGMVVAVLDTGLDYSHEAFSTMPSNPAWTKEYVAAKMAASTRFNAQATVDEVYYNSKVPFAYDYADDDADVYPSYSTHGTHVAGIVAGKSDYVVNKETGETFVGVAPEAQLVICKVFTDNLDSDSLGGADTIDIIAAVSDCVELGVDVINMSLGSSAGFSDEKSDELINEVYNRVRAAGISLVVAASNDYSSGFGGGNGTNLASNPDSGTVGSPSTYGAALSVASINGQKATFIQANNDENQVAFITESSDANGNEYDFVERLYNIAGKSKGDTLNFKYVVVGGVGRATNYTSKIRRELQDKTGYDGTIALIKRGDTTFADKVQTAMDNGADAVIIYNNLSGTIRMSLGDVNNPVPTCSIPMDAGKVFVEKADKGVGSVQINSEFKAGPFMSDFSSWGPTPDLQLKPEITAHGGEITSAVPGGYDVYSGTSMAAPNMSGAIALLRQHLKTANPTLTGVELNARVNQVLMSTATIALNDEGNPYSPRKQGAGLAGIADAINAESFITVKDKDGTLMWVNSTVVNGKYTYNGDDVLMLEFYNTIGEISGRVNSNGTISMMVEYGMSATVEYTFTKSDLTVFGEYFNEDGDSLTFSDGNVTLNCNKISLNADKVAETYSRTIKGTYEIGADGNITFGGAIKDYFTSMSASYADDAITVTFVSKDESKAPSYENSVFGRPSSDFRGKPYVGSFSLSYLGISSNKATQNDYTLIFKEDGSFVYKTKYSESIGAYYSFKNDSLIKINYEGYYSTFYYYPEENVFFGRWNSGTTAYTYAVLTNKSEGAQTVYLIDFDTKSFVAVTETGKVYYVKDAQFIQDANIVASDGFEDGSRVTIDGKAYIAKKYVTYNNDKELLGHGLETIGAEEGTYTYNGKTFTLNGIGEIADDAKGHYWTYENDFVVVMFSDRTIIGFDYSQAQANGGQVTLVAPDKYQGIWCEDKIVKVLDKNLNDTGETRLVKGYYLFILDGYGHAAYVYLSDEEKHEYRDNWGQANIWRTFTETSTGIHVEFNGSNIVDFVFYYDMNVAYVKKGFNGHDKEKFLYKYGYTGTMELPKLPTGEGGQLHGYGIERNGGCAQPQTRFDGNVQGQSLRCGVRWCEERVLYDFKHKILV